MAEKKSWVMYDSWIPLFESLPQESAANLILAVCRYRTDKSYVPDDPLVVAPFNMIKSTMDDDERKYQKTCESRAESGREGGKAKASKTKQRLANVSKSYQNVASLADKDKDKDKDINILSDSKESDCPTPSVEPCLSESANRVIDEWNKLQDCGIKPISRLTDGGKRKALLYARLREYGEIEMIRAIHRIRASDFLAGRNGRGWMITFDWFILPSNFPKVLEGNYDNSGARNGIEAFVSGGVDDG